MLIPGLTLLSGLLSIIEQPADVQVWHIASLQGPPANVGSLGSSGNARRALKTRMTRLRLYRKYTIELVALQPDVLVLATADEVIE